MPAEWLKRIPNAAELGRGLRLREYTPERLDALKYTEAGLTTLRRMTRGEQLNAKLLAPEIYDLIFSGVIAFVAPDPGRQGKAWDLWYKFLTETHGLGKKAAFIGMSKGGVNAFNWGGVNPDKVAAITPPS